MNNIYKGFAAAAGLFLLTACNDTDAQYDIPEIAAPEFVGVVSHDINKPLLFGNQKVELGFDKNIGFATENTSKVTLNGKSVPKALVYGASKNFTIETPVSFEKKQTFKVPAGLIVGPQYKTCDQDVEVTFEYKNLPSNEAMTMTKNLGLGWNLGNHFDTSNTQWGYWDGATPGAALFQKIAAAGLKSVRIPATWTNHMSEDGVISADYLAEVGDVVSNALSAGLYVILNTHHDSFETLMLADAAKTKADSTEAADLIKNTWGQIAKYFKEYDEKLIFETFNEVHSSSYDADGNLVENWGEATDEEYAMLNVWNQLAVDTIRATGGKNANRWIGVSGYTAGIDNAINHLVLPKDKANRIMVGVHTYDPYNFCLDPTNGKEEGADDFAYVTSEWGHTGADSAKVAGADEDYILAQLYKLREAYIDKGIPCYLGEMGCVYQPTDRANEFRKYYLEFFCRAASYVGLPMMMWDNNSIGGGKEHHGFFDHTTGDFLNDASSVIPVMLKAATTYDDDSTYGLQQVYDNAPAPIVKK